MKENWFILGDIHGDTAPLQYFYSNNKERLNLDEADNKIILLGDVGANYFLDAERAGKMKEPFMKLPFTYICLRGNHEARVENARAQKPEAWEIKEKYGGLIYVEKEFPRIEYLVDGPAVYNFNGYKTLSIPGAYSVDKWYRLQMGYTWYEDEQLADDEMGLAMKMKEENNEFDLVISHTCPMIYEPVDLFLQGIDQSRVDRSMEVFLNELELDLNYKRWAFGHFHANRLYPWDNGKQMLMLACDKVVDLNKFMNMSRMDSMEDIRA